MAHFEDIIFRALDREAEISVSYGENLPHWFQVGAATLRFDYEIHYQKKSFIVGTEI